MARNVQLKNDSSWWTHQYHARTPCGDARRKDRTWLDTGTIEATLETNRYLLGRNQHKTQSTKRSGVKIIEPAFIDESAEVEDSTIGPYASIGKIVKSAGATIENSIIEAECEIKDAALNGSMVGKQAKIEGNGKSEAYS